MKRLPWTEEEIGLLVEHGGTRQLHELVDLLPVRTKIAIKRKREELGIKASSRDYLSRKGTYASSHLDPNKLCKVDQFLTIENLDGDVLQVLLGSILGDGGVKKTGKTTTRNFIFSEMHKRPQFAYTEWKAEKLTIFHAKTSRSEENNYCQLWTASHPIFTKIRDSFYPTRSKCNKCFMPIDMLKDIGYLGMLVWYLDDGYVGSPKGSNKSPQPHISAKGWQLADLTAFIYFINEKLGLALKVKTYNHKGKTGLDKRVSIGKKDREKLFPIWQDLASQHDLPKCMDYKLNKKDA